MRSEGSANQLMDTAVGFEPTIGNFDRDRIFDLVVLLQFFPNYLAVKSRNGQTSTFG
jgi:hypothetical protein